MFEKIFLSSESVDIYNYKKYKGKQQLAITHNDTNIVLIVEQSINKESNKKDNYLVCAKLENKNKFILEKALTISSQLFIPTNEEIKNKKILNQSEANFEGQLLDISELMEKIDELPLITPIEDTSEYKKWKIYLELLEKKLIEKSKSFKVNIQFNQDIATFKKPKNKDLKFEKDKELLVQNLDNKESIKFGKIFKISNNIVSVNLYNNFEKNNEKEFELSLNNIGDKAQLDILKRGLINIKNNDFRFYIFGNQKLSTLDGWKSLDINFKNNSLNNKQKESIKKALVSEKIFMIQGPPGTGKTSVISEIAYQETMKGNKVLISSESNDAIENAIERLNEDIFYPILYQSVSRQEKNSSTNLPIEKDIGNFYKKRVLNSLKFKIDSVKKIGAEINSIKNKISKEEKNIQNNINRFKEFEQKESRIKNYEKDLLKDLDIIKKEYEQKNETQKNRNIFLDIQNDFFKELNQDTTCEDELKEIYLKKANIVGATLNQIGKVSKKSNNSNLFDVVIIDEVSKATPIELNLAILKAKKIILVGDQKQLPPMLDRDITLEEFADKIWKNSEEDESKKEIKKELYEHKTVFEKLIETNPHASTQLTMQYRMHENIQKAINQFYDEDLECGLDNKTRINQHKLFNSKNLVWIDTFSKENKIGTSFENREEINQTKKILEKLNKEYQNIDFSPTIGVISFYGRQVNGLSNIKNDFKNIKVDFGTVDTFQGQERDFIIVSMVRSNNRYNIGFARSLNRINVAFSRAKQLLVILGNSHTFTKVKSNDNDDIKKAKDVYKKIFNMSLKEEL